MAYAIQRIDGLIYGQSRRDVVFLQSTENGEINAWQVFERLKDKHRREMLDRFDLWKRGDQHHNKYFHGFTQTGYRECFVFKRKQAGTYHRFYGFLIHPQPNTNAQYHLCVLVQHGQKNDENTDPSELNFVNRVRLESGVQAAVKGAFPEKHGGWNDTLHRSK